MSEIAQTVSSVRTTVNRMNASLNNDGLQIYDDGDTVTTVTGDGMKVNVLSDMGLAGPILGEELLNASSTGVEAARLTAKEELTVKGELFNLMVKSFYNDDAQITQIGFFAAVMENNV